MIGIAREYILGLMIETARKELPVSDPTAFKRNVELAAYFTHCELQPAHSLLSLQVAMAQAYKAKCFATAAIMIRRLLELGPPPQLAQKVCIICATIISINHESHIGKTDSGDCRESTCRRITTCIRTT